MKYWKKWTPAEVPVSLDINSDSPQLLIRKKLLQKYIDILVFYLMFWSKFSAGNQTLVLWEHRATPVLPAGENGRVLWGQ